jgi:uncharacterized protein YjbI with pentapeptide repeats
MPATVVDVEPRVYSPRTGDRIRLVDAVENFLNRADRGVVVIEGHPLETTSAIHRLCAHFGDALAVGDGWSAEQIAVTANDMVVVLSTKLNARTIDLRLRLANWDQDDLTDYLLMHHRSSCGSILARVRGTPAIWRPTTSVGWRCALSALAFHPYLEGLADAIEQVIVARGLAHPMELAETARTSLYHSLAELEVSLNTSYKRSETPPPSVTNCLLLDTAYLNGMALRYWLDRLREKRIPSTFGLMQYGDLTDSLAELILKQKVDWRFLLDPYRGRTGYQPIVAALLARLDSKWRPDARQGWFFFKGANFAGVHWPDWKLTGTQETTIDLAGANFTDADLRSAQLKHVAMPNAKLHGVLLDRASLESVDCSGANFATARLNESKFNGVDAAGASFHLAVFERAELHIVNLMQADFSKAQLHHSSLKEVAFSNALFAEADFERSIFSRCALKQCDLRTVKLIGASFHRCQMSQCNLEEVEFPNGDFWQSNLSHAWLTGSVMPNAILRLANLSNAGLGDIEWEGADLREADFTNAAFHFGSTRSGLVDSPYPSHGTRTGFYTDEYFDQPFKSPEEIRKANLRGADLRGAKIKKADFYLVDLRDAKIDANQLPHLQRCGAILK